MKEKYITTGRTNQKQETRAKILESAKYFLNKGLQFNLEDIAKKTGISRATIYRYYSNVEILTNEAGLDISTKSPEYLHQNLVGENLEDQVLEVQHYYNTLTIEHEKVFRKYLSSVLASKSSEFKRGARRKKTLNLLMKNSNIPEKDKEDLINLLTILMGMEPFIVSKDVCGLNNQESLELLKRGALILLKGFEVGKEK
ncbi:MAG: TetR/AcrR family transcriptional regulator [Flavobacteriaceae bacterium]